MATTAKCVALCILKCAAISIPKGQKEEVVVI